MTSATHDPNLAHTLCREARATLEKAEKDLAGSGAAAALARGRVFELVGYFEAAASAYGEALSHDPQLIEARARQVLSHLKAGHAERALQLATPLAATHREFQLHTLATGETFSVMTILGDALVANNRLEDAVEAYKIARQINPHDNYATAHLAEIYLATNRQQLASDLASSIRPPTRFEALKTVLGLGGVNLALLPAGRSASLVANIRLIVPGRPMDVRGEQRVAVIEDSGEEWCADLTGYSEK